MVELRDTENRTNDVKKLIPSIFKYEILSM